MNCVRIFLLVCLIPLALRGASLLGVGGGAVVVVVAVVTPSPSPDQQQRSASGSGVGYPAAPRVGQWRQMRRMGRQSSSRVVVAAPRRFGGGFFGDDKRFAPTGSNPLHNL